MFRSLRKHLIQSIWNKYRSESAEMQRIHQALEQHQIHTQPLDHFAIIDLPSAHSGIPILQKLFASIGYETRGTGYLPEKQNDFLWLAEENCEQQLAKNTLPQVVVADFRLDEMPIGIRNIIEKYTRYIQPAPLSSLQTHIQKAVDGDPNTFTTCATILGDYLSGREWPLPLVREYYAVKEFNELLAWVLVFGRRPNHFTLSIHLFDHFSSLAEFHQFIETEARLPLNLEGGLIKGGKSAGIEQGSTNGILQTVALADGNIQTPCGFVEFVWRHAHTKPQLKASAWQDYFTGFIATHANKVIESLCIDEALTC